MDLSTLLVTGLAVRSGYFQNERGKRNSKPYYHLLDGLFRYYKSGVTETQFPLLCELCPTVVLYSIERNAIICLINLRYAFLSDLPNLTDLKVDFCSLLFCVLIFDEVTQSSKHRKY